MPKIIDYEMVGAQNPQQMSEYMRTRLTEGWQPYGNPFTYSYTDIMQAVVKYATEEVNEQPVSSNLENAIRHDVIYQNGEIVAVGRKLYAKAAT